MQSSSDRRWLVLALSILVSAASVAAGASHGAQSKAPRHGTGKPAATAADTPGQEYDRNAERLLLELANQSRAQAGAAALALDSGLSQAARTHAAAMLEAGQLSHRFDGEPSLSQRLAASTRLQLDQVAENVALDFDPAKGHQHLMLSPPHRANLLNPAYNVVGMGVVRDGERLYIVEDFGHALPNYSPVEVKARIASAVNQIRRESRRPELARRDLATADEAACSMAQADTLGTASIQQLAKRYTVLTFTSVRSDTLPSSAGHAVASPNLRNFSVGACYARTHAYPTGVYWVLLTLD